jgi:hypothetical protein
MAWWGWGLLAWPVFSTAGGVLLGAVIRTADRAARDSANL